MTFLSLWILNTQHTPCLIASGAVHLIGNFPPSKLKSAPLASPKSDTCKNKKNNVLFMKLNAQIQSIIVNEIEILSFMDNPSQTIKNKNSLMYGKS